MHQRPIAVDRLTVQQMSHRPRAVRGKTILDLGNLLGNMQMDRPRAAQRRQRGKHDIYAFHRYRTQAVEAHADAQPLRFLRTQRVDQSQIGIGVVRETLLALVQRAAIESTALVKHRQQRQADAGITGGGDDGARHRRRIVVGTAVRLVMHVVELADRRVTGHQHLGVKLRGHGVKAVGIHAASEGVHLLAPGPEAVGGIGLVFREARHRSLEGMRMRIRHTRQPVTGQQLRAGGQAVVKQRHVALPAIRRPQLFNLDSGVAHGGRIKRKKRKA